jgi:hypothetical protein
MRKHFLILVIPFLAFVCSRKQAANCHTGKVIRTSCASFVVQLTDTQTLGQMGWKDQNTGNTYDHVINITNRCMLKGDLKDGETIRFVIDSTIKNTCITCLMYDAPPNVNYTVHLCK